MMMMTNTEMLHRLDMPENNIGIGMMNVLERQQARMKWQEVQAAVPCQQQQQQLTQLQQMGLDYFNATDQLSNMFSAPAPAQHFHGGLMINDQNLGGLLLNPSMVPDTCVQSSSSNQYGNVGGDSFGLVGSCELGSVTGFGLNYGVSRTNSCPPAVAAALAEAASAAAKRKEAALPEKLASTTGRESFKKRKPDKTQNQKVAVEDQSKDNKGKGCVEEEVSRLTEQRSKDTTNNSNNNKTEPLETSKENSKVSEVQKPDYIHVRARRGQATDSHSLAERVRREKISERMKYLQDLVPGCNKIIGKAGMLDEIINYVQSLQRQVEFLSLKLATVNPRLDLDIDNLLSKEIFPVSSSGAAHVMEVSSEMNNPPNYNFASLEQVVSCCGLETDNILPDMALRRTISAPVSLPETLIDSSYLSQIHPYSVWDAELQSLYPLEFQQGRSSASLLSQPCTGFDGGNNVKMEM